MDLKRYVQSFARFAGFEFEKNFESGRYQIRKYVDIRGNPWAAVKTILGRDPAVILDVGANTGQTALELARRFPKSKIYSFEPTPHVAEKLRRNTAHLPNVEVIEAAVGDKAGTAELHVNRFDQTNSLLASSDESGKYNQTAAMQETVGTVTVSVVTIEDFCAERRIDKIDVLKTDAQGYDLRIIEGAGRMLDSTVLIYCELCFVELYDQQDTAGEVIDRLSSLAFKLVDLYETGYRLRFHQLSCNGLFIREDGPLPVR